MTITIFPATIKAAEAAMKEAFRQELMDDDGENRAVRCFLMLYGQQGVTALSMKRHMEASGFPYYPDWVSEAPGHLTKGGAQLWLRLLFALET